MRERFSIFIFIPLILLFTLNFFLDSSFATPTDDDNDNNKLSDAKNKLSISYVDNVAPSYDVSVNSNEKYTVSQSYSWVRDETSRYNLVSYSIDGDDFIPISRVARGNFTIDFSMDSPHTAVFLAVPQYPISVEGLGDNTFTTTSPTGDNWFDAGSLATITVVTPNDFLIRKILDGWDGSNVESEGNSARLIVDSPITITAKWKTDYSQLILIGIIPVGAGIAYAFKQRQNKSKKSDVIEKAEEKISTSGESPQFNVNYINEIKEYQLQKSIEKLNSLRNSGLIDEKKYEKLTEKIRNDT